MSKPACQYRLTEVTHSRGGGFALRLAELEVPCGEILCLLGPTGAGKSTLLRLLAGLESPNRGRVEFQQQPFPGPRASLDLRRRITLVFQRPLMLAGSVRHNVQYGLRLRGSRETAAKAQHIITRLGLAPLADRPAGSLSGGQMQLVALARALALETDVLLLDEPTANLDPAHVALVEEVIKELHQRCRTTVVWATHHLFQARRVAQRVALLLDGSLVEVAATERFFQAPADARTAAFVQGRMIY